MITNATINALVTRDISVAAARADVRCTDII